MRTVFVGLSVFALLLLASFVDGSGCVVRQRVVHHAQAVVVQEPVVAAVFAPITVAVPAYSVAYADNTQAELQRLRAEIELQKLRNEFEAFKVQQLQQPEKIQQPPKKLAVGEHPAVEILRKNCAACHSDNAKAKGGGFTLFDTTGIAKLTDKQSLSVAREVFAGRMPKGSKGLSDADVGQVMSWLDTLK